MKFQAQPKATAKAKSASGITPKLLTNAYDLAARERKDALSNLRNGLRILAWIRALKSLASEWTQGVEVGLQASSADPEIRFVGFEYTSSENVVHDDLDPQDRKTGFRTPNMLYKGMGSRFLAGLITSPALSQSTAAIGLAR